MALLCASLGKVDAKPTHDRVGGTPWKRRAGITFGLVGAAAAAAVVGARAGRPPRRPSWAARSRRCFWAATHHTLATSSLAFDPGSLPRRHGLLSSTNGATDGLVVLGTTRRVPLVFPRRAQADCRDRAQGQTWSQYNRRPRHVELSRDARAVAARRRPRRRRPAGHPAVLLHQTGDRAAHSLLLDAVRSGADPDQPLPYPEPQSDPDLHRTAAQSQALSPTWRESRTPPAIRPATPSSSAPSPS